MCDPASDMNCMEIAYDFWDVFVYKVFSVLRGPQQSFRGGQERRSLLRSADLDHLITLVSETIRGP